MPDFLADLNPEQLAAVTLPPQHALILAGAGSGKTRVLTTRIAWLISTGQVEPQNLLAVTFTNKAAREMLFRLSAMLPLNVRSMWIGTFHGLCNRLLRVHHRDAGLPPTFQILDSADQLSAIKRLLKNLGVDEDDHPSRELAAFINSHKEQGLRASAAEAYDNYTRRRVALYAEYEAQCQREGVADFAELLLRAHELLGRNEPLRQHYQARFQHILVDEFQDTNRLQFAWIKRLAGHDEAGKSARENGARVFAVGDDDQSIYAFRGAEVGNMRRLEKEFKVGKVIRLEQNYRSQGNILDAANALIKHNRGRIGKNLWTQAGAGEPLRVFSGFSDDDEACFVVDEARGLIRQGLEPRQVAVLYRSNAQSRALEHRLFSAGLPYRVHGGLRFFDRMEVKHALAYLRLIANPDDDTAFSRVVNFPARGIGSRSLEALREAAHHTHASLYNAAAGLSGKAGVSVGNFVRLIETLRAETSGLPLPEVIEHLIEKSGLHLHYLNDKEGTERLENLGELINAASRFVEEGDADSPNDPLASFLAHASLEAGDVQLDEGQNAVQLMTVHAAKGLEFDIVFITGLEQGLFPHENSMSERQGLEEERRLMYVALTRARKHLYLTYAQTRMLHGQTRYGLPSLFLEELPDELLRPVGARNSLLPESGKGLHSGFRVDEPEDDNGFRVGQNVRHAKFGLGIVIAAEGYGRDVRLQVNFGAQGTKWLALEYAKLTVAQ